MNGLEEIQDCIKSFIDEKVQIQKEIAKIEEKRTQLAQVRNEKKKNNTENIEINELGKQISELGNQSQELQNKLDFKVYGVKSQINLIIDNSVAESMRKIRKINDEILELEQKNTNLKERSERYKLQKQEFYLRFGRIPELSENAKKDNEFQEKEAKTRTIKIEKLKKGIEDIKDQITILAVAKRNIKNGNWNLILENEDVQEDEIRIEPVIIEELEPIEELYIEEFGTVEEIYVEPFELMEEIKIGEIGEIEEIEELEPIENIEASSIDEIEQLARAIVEEIVIEQTSPKVEEEIIPFEEKAEKKEKVIIPLFGQKTTISNITVKIEEKQLLYKAQMSNGEEIKIYPTQLSTENVILRDKQNREECKEILINYAISEYKAFDKKVMNKIDPLICELLIECAEKYNLEAQNLIYNYAMSFSDSGEIDLETVPGIVYNLSYIEESELNRKEKSIIKKICKNTSKNSRIEVIESFTGFRKVKYLFKRIFAVNNVKVLPEAKY